MATNIAGTWLNDEIERGSAPTASRQAQVSFEGSSRAEIINGLKGDDYLNGKENNDTLYGGAGSDTLIGSEGNDRLFGQIGDDVLFGTGGNDSLWGFWGRDSLYGGSGDDVLEGNSAADYLYGEEGRDVLMGGFGNDTLLSGFSYDNKIEEDTLVGGKGKDTFDLTAFFTFGEGAIDFVTPNIAVIRDFNPEQGDSIELYPMEDFKRATGLSLQYEYSVNTEATDVIIEAEIEGRTYTLAVLEDASDFY